MPSGSGHKALFHLLIGMQSLSVLFQRSEWEGPSWSDSLCFVEREDGFVFAAALTSGGTGSCYE